MFYQMRYDMDGVDRRLSAGESFIYAEDDNLDEIVYDGIKQGFFHTIILKNVSIDKWPRVAFYYSSKASGRESDFLCNARNWPLVHAKVKTMFETNGIRGVSFYPIALVDVVSNQVNKNYYLLFVHSFIDAYDLEKSEYKYNVKYKLYTFLPHKTYLDQETCSSFDIFRCRHHPAVVYISQKLADLVRAFTGFSFIPQK